MDYPEGRWSRIDEFRRPSHIKDSDLCFYYYEYNPEEGFLDAYARRTVRSLVLNLKKRPRDIADRPDLKHYKDEAIEYFVVSLVNFFKCCTVGQHDPLLDHANECAVIPAFSSKTRDDPEYDDRIDRVCENLAARTGFSVTRPFVLRDNVPPAHLGGLRSPELYRTYLDTDMEQVTMMRQRAFKLLFFIDDIITSGAHYAAVKGLIQRIAPDATFAGVFLGKTVRT